MMTPLQGLPIYDDHWYNIGYNIFANVYFTAHVETWYVLPVKNLVSLLNLFYFWLFYCYSKYYTRNSGSSSCIRCGGKYTYTLLKNLLDVCNPIFNLQTKFDEIGWKLLILGVKHLCKMCRGNFQFSITNELGCVTVFQTIIGRTYRYAISLL